MAATGTGAAGTGNPENRRGRDLIPGDSAENIQSIVFYFDFTSIYALACF